MTVSELISELQRFSPHKPVHACVRSVFFRDEKGETMIDLCELDAAEVKDVQNEGSHVLLWGGGR